MVAKSTLIWLVFLLLIVFNTSAKDAKKTTLAENYNNLKVSAALLPEITAFPGAEGFGKYASGGRGGKVYIVTNLNDDGPGSLREAVEATGPRTVVFAVSGTIELESPLGITNDDITIAGQTAPGDGICLKNYNLAIYNVENVIVRYIRSRLGVDRRHEHDAMSGRFANNVIIDHCSFSWAVDETIGPYDNSNMTIQWCIISESLYDSYHSEGPHGMGAFIGGKGLSFHHNLLAHHHNRNPRFCGSRYSNEPDLEKVDYRNNVIYNWALNTCYGGEGGSYNMVNNYYRYGPATNSSRRKRIVAPREDDGGNAQPAGTWGSFYVAGNFVEDYPDVTNNNWLGVEEVSEEEVLLIKSNTPFEMVDIQLQSPHEAYNDILNHAGASLPKRDRVDARVTEETRTRTTTYGVNWPGIINHPNNVGGYPELETEPPPLDTDEDGMPDNWEDGMGLDKNDPEDGKIITESGYSNLELYLNSLVADFTYFLRPMEVSASVDDKTVHLSWTDLSANEEGFMLERAAEGQEFVFVDSLVADTETYSDTSITEYGEYIYRIKAWNSETETCFTDGLKVNVANPDPPDYILTINIEGEGEVYLDPPGNIYVEGTSVGAIAEPSAGWEFDEWTGEVDSSGNTAFIVMDQNRTITATFTQLNVGTANDLSDNDLNIFPIPATNEAFVDIYAEKACEVEITIIDTQGKLVKKTQRKLVSAGKNNVNLNLAGIHSGMYLLMIRSNHFVGQKRFLVQ